jgi:hypothetical protein
MNIGKTYILLAQAAGLAAVGNCVEHNKSLELTADGPSATSFVCALSNLFSADSGRQLNSMLGGQLSALLNLLNLS